MQTNRFPYVRLVLGGALLVLTACTGGKVEDTATDSGDSGTDSGDSGTDSGDSGTDSGDTGTDTGSAPAGDAVLLGRVIEAGGTVLEGVSIVLQSGESTVTDAAGLFRFDGLGTGATDEEVKAIATFSKSDFMRSTQIFSDLDASERTWQVSMLPRAAGVTFDAASTAEIELLLGSGGSLTIHPGTLVDGSGTPATGQATAYLTMIDVNQTSPLRASPGDFSAVLTDASNAKLESWGMAELLVQAADGSELKLAPGATADVEMPIILPRAGRDPQPGETIGFFWFDETTGLWMQDGEAVNSSNGTFIAPIDEFGHWNSDKPMETTCVSVEVHNSDGTPREDIQVEAMGLDYSNYQDFYTDATGTAYLLVRRNSELSATVYDIDGTDLAATTITTPNTIGDCQDLLDAGTLQLVYTFTL